MLRRSLVAGLGLVLLLGLGGVGRADVVTDWNNVTLNAIRADKTAPPKAARALALVQVSVFDAVVSILGPYATHHENPQQFPGPSSLMAATAAAAAAAHTVLVELFPAQQERFDAALAASLASVTDPVAKNIGQSWGVLNAGQILNEHENDGSAVTVAYEAPTGANWWAPTPPAFAAPLLPNWAYVTTWSGIDVKQYRQGPPPASTSPEYAAAFREVRRLGRVDSQFRTPEQTQIALFWADGPGTATPPGHWFVIAQGISHQRGLSLVENARLFALLGIAVADAGVVAWDHKYNYSTWRPVTGIRLADTDGNPETTADAGWTPLIATPPFPSYISGHSTFSAAAARILELYFGIDAVPFTTTSDALPGVQRSFSSFSQAAEEAGQSRVYGGIHWQFDNQAGLAAGRALADNAFFSLLARVETPGPCTAGDANLCLAGGRFKVEARWRTANGSGPAHAASLGSDSGRFWFFDEDNTELTVKVLDACQEFDRFWVFASGLTNVEVTVTVTDTHSGRTRQYFNPRGKAFAPVQDTNAFATCD
jgi:membrane-associated phospholipid phosphatase